MKLSKISLVFALTIFSSDLAGAGVMGVLRYGDLHRQYAGADFVAIATIKQLDGNCTSGKDQAGKAVQLCEDRLSLTNLYKTSTNSAIQTDLTITHVPLQREFAYTGAIREGDQLLVFLCSHGTTISYCDNTSSRVALPRGNRGFTGAGYAALVNDTMMSLASKDSGVVIGNGRLLWDLGVHGHLNQLNSLTKAVPNSLVPTILALRIEENDPSSVGDLVTAVQSTSMSNADWSLLAISLDRAAPNTFGSVIPTLVNSSTPSLQRGGLALLEKINNVNALPVLSSLLDSPSPDIAFRATKALEKVTGHTSSSRLIYSQFMENPTMRKNYLGEWKSWLASNKASN